MSNTDLNEFVAANSNASRFTLTIAGQKVRFTNSRGVAGRIANYLDGKTGSVLIVAGFGVGGREPVWSNIYL